MRKATYDDDRIGSSLFGFKALIRENGHPIWRGTKTHQETSHAIDEAEAMLELMEAEDG